MAGSHHTGRRPNRISSIGLRTARAIADARRVSEADLRLAIYVRPDGLGIHVVKNPCNDQEYKVADATAGATFSAGAAVVLGSFTGNPGEMILGRPPAGFGGASGYSVNKVDVGHTITATQGAGDFQDPPPPQYSAMTLATTQSGTFSGYFNRYDLAGVHQSQADYFPTVINWSGIYNHIWIAHDPATAKVAFSDGAYTIKVYSPGAGGKVKREIRSVGVWNFAPLYYWFDGAYVHMVGTYTEGVNPSTIRYYRIATDLASAEELLVESSGGLSWGGALGSTGIRGGHSSTAAYMDVHSGRTRYRFDLSTGVRTSYSVPADKPLMVSRGLPRADGKMVFLGANTVGSTATLYVLDGDTEDAAPTKLWTGFDVVDPYTASFLYTMLSVGGSNAYVSRAKIGTTTYGAIQHGCNAVSAAAAPTSAVAYATAPDNTFPTWSSGKSAAYLVEV